MYAIDPPQSSVASDLSKDNVARFQAASAWRARWQMINSFVPYVLLWFAMDRALAVSYWLMLPIAILAAGFLARIFIIFHDCGHGSFFKSHVANDVWGFLCGIVTFTPYYHWRWEHSLHHATSGDLDRRGTGLARTDHRHRLCDRGTGLQGLGRAVSHVGARCL